MTRQLDMLPLLGIVKEKAVPDNGNFFIVGMAYIIRKKIKCIISAIFLRKNFCRFFRNVCGAKTFPIYDTHGRVCMEKPVKIRVDIYFFG